MDSNIAPEILNLLSISDQNWEIYETLPLFLKNKTFKVKSKTMVPFLCAKNKEFFCVFCVSTSNKGSNIECVHMNQKGKILKIMESQPLLNESGMDFL